MEKNSHKNFTLTAKGTAESRANSVGLGSNSVTSYHARLFWKTPFLTCFLI